MSNAARILAVLGLGSLAAGGAYLYSRRKPSEEPEPEPGAAPPTLEESHDLPSTLYTNQAYTARITITNPNASSQTYKVMVGIGCYPGVYPERCAATNTTESQGGQAAASIGAGATKTVSVPIYLGRFDRAWTSGYGGKLAVVCHVIDSFGVAQIVNHEIGDYESFPYVQKP
ncbi:MAG: hypothetical protein WC551_09940 [Patescibacteria group bacterium]